MKARVGRYYTYRPRGIDTFDPCNRGLLTGDRVKVVNKFGCPPANTMGQCYVERNGVFMGMVSISSLFVE